MEYRIISSQKDPLKKAVFFEGEKEKYYCVAFFEEEENECVICVSSQIGCPENCRFCATADQCFVRNLSKEEIKEEIEIGLNIIYELVGYSLKDKQISIIFEGMGEASYNIDNCFQAFLECYEILKNNFKKVNLRISSVGNINLHDKYILFIENNRELKENVDFQVKLSLHTVYDSERKYLTPNISKKYDLYTIIKQFNKLSEKLGSKLIVNYLLFDYPDGHKNYSMSHLIKLGKIINSKNTKITLGFYSDTNKGFISPKETIYSKFQYYLTSKCNIETSVIKLYGQDINAACGMLHYQE